MNEKDKKLYMIGNAHLDPVWLWRWQEGFQEAKATFRSALDRMKEYPDFVFTCSSAAFYEWVENSDPKMFEEIRERVREGRWAITGGWWIQPDCNIPCGESYVRQGLYGQRYFCEKFGVMAHTGYNVDSFGHNGMIPQILKKSCMNHYVFMRPGRHEKGLPNNTFLWRSPDGSCVTAFRIPFEYTWNKDLEIHIERCASEIKNHTGSIMGFYGVGNHGGGPTKLNIEIIKKLGIDPAYPELIMASPEQYFKDVLDSGADLPVVEGELLHHASGCYSAHSEVKALNRKAENRLLMAEKFSVMAHIIAGQKYPLEQYTRAWKDVLFNQFHDILAGSSIESAYEDARHAYSASIHTAEVNMNYAVQAISWRINIPFQEDMKPIVIFNPNAFAGKFEIEMESSVIKEGFILQDDHDQPVAFQQIQSEATCNGRCRICFIADLPSLGYRTYRLVKRDVQPEFDKVRCTDSVMENSLLRAEFDDETGSIKSLVIKNSGAEFFSGPAALPVVIEDNSDTWSHGVRRFNKVIGQFKAIQVKCVERGPVKSVIRVISTYGSSKIIQDFTMYNNLDYIPVKTTVDWREQFKMLKLRFPLNLNYLRGSFEIPYGFTQREPDGEEYPMQSWMDFEGAAPKAQTPVVGLSIINDGKTSCNAEQKTVGMTVLRSPIYAHHEPFVPKNDHLYSFLDQGIQHFHYILYPHAGSWENAETVQLAQGLNQKPVSLFESCHEGDLPQKGSFLVIDEPNISIGAMKMAEDGSGDIILRLVETSKKQTEVTISLPFINKEIRTRFSPCEIKTLRIPLNGAGKPKEINMIETEES